MQRCVCVSVCYQHSKLTFMMCTQSQADRKILVHELAYYIMDQLKKVNNFGSILIQTEPIT